MAITLGQAVRSVRANLNEPAQVITDERIIDFINEAIDFSATENLYIPVVDDTLDQLADDYEYPLTGGELANIKYIYNIALESEVAGLFDQSVERGLYWIHAATIPILNFTRYAWSPTATRGLRIYGGKPQARVTDVDTTIYLPMSYIIWKATSFAHGVLAGTPNSTRGRWHESRVNASEVYAEAARVGAKEFHLPSKIMWIPGRV